ncbi:hypothetical protein [Ekhidna sp.]
MKRLSNLLAALVFASLVIFMSCGGGGDDPAPDPLADDLANLTVSGGWSNPTTVTTDNGTADGVWTTFGISFTGTVDGGTYTVSNVPDGFSDVWADGTWTFGNDNGSVITRVQGGVTTDITASIADGSLTLTFDVTESGARTSGISGEWTFVFN